MELATWQAKVAIRACRFFTHMNIKKEELSSLPRLQETFQQKGITVTAYQEEEIPIPHGFAERRGEEEMIFLAQNDSDEEKVKTLYRCWYELAYHLHPFYRQLEVMGLAPSSSSKEGPYFASLILEQRLLPAVSTSGRPGCSPDAAAGTDKSPRPASAPPSPPPPSPH